MGKANSLAQRSKVGTSTITGGFIKKTGRVCLRAKGHERIM
jgi:hypothetical protein